MIMDSVKKELKYLMRYGKQFKSLIKKDGIGVVSDKEYWLAWRPFCKEKYIIFRMHTGFGLGYLIPSMIESFEWANEMGFIPMVCWSSPLEQMNDFRVNIPKNIWDCFFVQHFNTAINGKTVLIGNQYAVYTSDSVKRRLHVREYDRGYMECDDPEWRDIFANYNKYFSKWFILKDVVQNNINDEWKDICKDGDKFLGVFLREEFSIDRSKLPKDDALNVHPWVMGIDEALKYIKEYKELTGCNKIYVASMFEDSINAFKNVFGDENVFCASRKRQQFKEFEQNRIELFKDGKKLEDAFKTNKSEMPFDLSSHTGYIKDIYFCAKCDSFAGHMCSGTRTALIVNGGKYTNYKMLPNYKDIDLRI